MTQILDTRLESVAVPLAGRLGEWAAEWRRGRPLGRRVANELTFSTLLDILPRSDDRPAVAGVTGSGRPELSFARLHEFLSSGVPSRLWGLRTGTRCAIAVPDGPELAVCLLAVSARCIAVPLNPWNPEGEIAADLAETGAQAVIVPLGDDYEHVRRAAFRAGTTVIGLAPAGDAAGLFDLVGPLSCAGDGAGRSDSSALNGPGDIALELFTSGTSGRKKRISTRLGDLCVGSACIAAALELGPLDRGYNMMPLFHVGGIVRNLYAPLLAGSPMTYSEGFDPALFWDELSGSSPFTWYYASPTMHEAILAEGERRPDADHPLRFIANAAGALLPSTAERLRERFGAKVLPGYGMTECMPIACPPLDYDLDRPGSSGRILGPEVRILDDAGGDAPPGVAGRIALHGAPLADVVADDQEDISIPAGWFDTGDIGRFDADGFLYIVGRGKDVIKRGGETIAPAEIENVVVGHPDVAAALAFSIPHEMLGETVGCVIVPRNGRRVDLDGLAPYLSDHLAVAKWPVLLVYMDDLPTNATGKLLRVQLASRLGITTVDERSPARSRLYEAECPPAGTPLSEPIAIRPVDCSPPRVMEAIRCAGPDVTAIAVDMEAGTLCAVVEVRAGDEAQFTELITGTVHDYLIPRAIKVVGALPRHHDTGEIDRESVRAVMRGMVQAADATPGDAVEEYILDQWRQSLGPDRLVALDSDFFDDLGGDSLTAVQIIATIRDRYRIALRPTSIFRARTVRELARTVRTAIAAGADGAAADGPGEDEPQGPPARSQARPMALLTQILPLAMIPTVLRVSQFGLWIVIWWYLQTVLGRSLLVMLAAAAAAGMVRNTFAPLIALAAKWVLVGRYRQGPAPLWGHRYLRWWLVQQIHAAAGLGLFGSSYRLTAFYYRLMGARVGRHTRIEPSADLGEFDLLDIGDGAIIDDSAIVRPFLLEGSAMSCQPIRLGRDVSVGTRATIVPGSVLPDGTEVSPLGTSDDPRVLNQGTRSLTRAMVYDTPLPLEILVNAIKAMLVLASWVPVLLLVHAFLAGLVPGGGHLSGPSDLLARMISPQRLIRTSAILVASTVASPFVYLAGAILVKWVVIGRFHAHDDVSRPWARFERRLMWQLLPDGRFGGVAPIVGSNFSAISVIYRLLGAKVGRRVYWPGSGNILTEYDLFEVGDDVTFGSRSTYLMTSSTGSQPIRIEAGANVADRCVLAPGVVVERNAVLGSGTFAPEGFVAPAGSTWIGQDGNRAPIELEAATPRRVEAPTLRPYGRAMHLGQASYRVWPLGAHIAFNLVWNVAAALYRSAPMIGALLLTWVVLLGGAPAHPGTVDLLSVTAGFLLVLQLLGAAGAVAITVATKWLIIGRRVAGNQFWTDSPYCQRWKIHSVISSLGNGWIGSRDISSLIQGSAYLVWYFRALGARIGDNVCLYPNGADPMMEEPELLDIGDHACIDQAVLIAHLNTRGEWMMGPIRIGAGAHLRSASRAMMMSTVGPRSTLLEGTLMLAGDTSREASTWKGWPGEAAPAGPVGSLRTADRT